jgi:hypothetical protein
MRRDKRWVRALAWTIIIAFFAGLTLKAAAVLARILAGA